LKTGHSRRAEGGSSGITALSLLNAALLGYLAWQQHRTDGCPGYHQVPFLPINDLTVALAGAGTSLVFAIFTCFLLRMKVVRYGMLILAGVAAGFGSFLQTCQFLFGRILCYPCLAATMCFYLIFCLLLYNLVLRPAWPRFKMMENTASATVTER